MPTILNSNSQLVLFASPSEAQAYWNQGQLFCVLLSTLVRLHDLIQFARVLCGHHGALQPASSLSLGLQATPQREDQVPWVTVMPAAFGARICAFFL